MHTSPSDSFVSLTEKIDDKQQNAQAKKYAEIFVENHQDSISAYFRFLDFPLKGKSVLDLGCGDGFDLAKIKSKGACIFGIDASEEMVNLALQKHPEAMIKVAYFDQLPFPDLAFDVVISKWALQNAAHIDPIYREIIRVLKPGGQLVYLTCHPLRQFIEKKRKVKDYFKKEIVESFFFDGKIMVRAPSHTMNEYLSPTFFEYFILEGYEEGFDSKAEKVEGDIYPSYFMVKAKRKMHQNSILSPCDCRLGIDILTKTSEHNALLIDTIRQYVLPRLKQRTRFLDVGSGAAIITKNIAREFTYTAAIEPNNELAPIYKNFPGVWHRCSFADYASSSLYDLVLCSHVLHHLADADLKAFIEKLLALTKLGGICLIALMAPRGQHHELQLSLNPNYVNSGNLIRILDHLGVSYTRLEAKNHFKGSSFQDMLALCRLFVLDGAFSPKEWQGMSFNKKQEIQDKIVQFAKQLTTKKESQFVLEQEEDYLVVYR
jgi:2-polyprenyl-3-methyl-5-hydroxy-6-metoxy-1,4-benzoquinol methylase